MSKLSAAEEARLMPEKYRHVRCEHCGAESNVKCRSRWGRPVSHVHVARVTATRQQDRKGET